MNSLAKWVWAILLCILFPSTLIVAGVIIVLYILIAWLKPEWLDKIE